MKDLRGKTAVVTGAAMGMGRLVAERLLRAGCRVALIDRDPEALARAAEELKVIGPEARPYVLDITHRPEVHETAQRIRSELGGADILVNSAGVVVGARFLDVPEEKHAWVVDVNLFGTMWMTRAFLPDMIAKGQGHIVNLASAGGIVGVPGQSSYCASKAAVIGFTEALRLEMKTEGHRGIAFTVVCPSYVSTGMFAGVKAPRFVPWLTPEFMSEKILEAIREEKPYVLEPFMVKLAPLIKAILPARLYDLYCLRTGIAQSMAQWTGHGR